MGGLLVIVPVRGGSKRLPGKHSMLLQGKSLLEWTAAAIADAALNAPCLLTTDAPELADRGRYLGWMVPFLRPPNLARDDSPTADAVLHALDWYVGEGNAEPEHLMLVQATSPLRKGAHLRGALRLLRERADAGSVVGICETEQRRHGHYWLGEQGFLFEQAPALDGKRVQPNGAVYVIEPAQLRRHRAFLTPKTLGYIMDAESSIDIDTIEDWRAAEAILAGRAENAAVQYR